MGVFTGIVVFLVTWWTVLFAVLPFGHVRDVDGTPKQSNIKKKFVWTTMVTIVVWIMIFTLIEADIISFQEMAQKMFEQDRLE